MQCLCTDMDKKATLKVGNNQDYSPKTRAPEICLQKGLSLFLKKMLC